MEELRVSPRAHQSVGRPMAGYERHSVSLIFWLTAGSRNFPSEQPFRSICDTSPLLLKTLPKMPTPLDRKPAARLRRRQECASKARVTNGGRFHPESCRLIRKLTSGSAGQLAGPKPRDKGRLGRSSDPAGRNVSEVRAGLERVDADADPSLARGRPRGQGSNRHMHLFGLPGYWTQHVGRVMRVIEGDPSGSKVAASTSLMAVDRAGVGQGRTTVEAG